MTSLKWLGIGAQAAADKTSLKNQLDSLAAENSGLKAKAAELTDEIARLKVESSEAQEHAKKSRLDAESRERETCTSACRTRLILCAVSLRHPLIGFCDDEELPLLTEELVMSCRCCGVGCRGYEGACWTRV
jgi:hypothetical protein